MEPSFDLYFGDEENEVQIRRIRKHVRDHSNPLDLPNAKFLSFFRLNKEAFVYVLDEIKDFLKPSERSTAIPEILKLCAALRFFAEGSYQKCSENDFNVGLAQPTISVVVKEVLHVLESKVCPVWIKSKMSETEQNASRLHFFENTRFPGVVGCVDGTHVRIIAPKKNIQHLYLDRKGYYSLNVMIVCDYKMNVHYVDARYPGSSHDSFVWNSSDYKQHLSNNIGENTWILGDAGYPLQPQLMTAFRATERGSPEARYNKQHARARNVVERTIGFLKGRFRCLLSSRALHYEPHKATQIVNCCCALHNVCKHFSCQYPDDVSEAYADDEVILGNHTEEANNAGIARSIRHTIMQAINEG